MKKEKDDYLKIILDENIPDDEVRKVLEGIEPNYLPHSDQKEILDLLREKRTDCYDDWHREVAEDYM